MRAIALDADAIFHRPDIRVWRTLPDRENCTLDVDLGTSASANAAFGDGGRVRLHVKRYVTPGGPVEEEVRGFQLLTEHAIPTAPLVGWGQVADGRSFTISEDLYGHTPADKLVESGTPFEQLLAPTADLTARLHEAGLHHRDLYLCHFMARPATNGAAELKLIDVARVRRLPGWPLTTRWVVKDLAQFWFSTMNLDVTEAERNAWLQLYCERRDICRPDRYRRAIERKARWIARHDEMLNAAQPSRNISLPG